MTNRSNKKNPTSLQGTSLDQTRSRFLSESPSNRELVAEEELENRRIKYLSKEESVKARQQMFKDKALPLKFPANPSLFQSGPKQVKPVTGVESSHKKSTSVMYNRPGSILKSGLPSPERLQNSTMDERVSDFGSA